MRGKRLERRDKMIQDERHDVHQERRKLPDPTVCNDCGAVFRGGRWSWKSVPEGAHRTTCPACRRIADKDPTGIVQIQGDFSAERRDEVMNLIRNTEKPEIEAHPMERVISVDDDQGIITLTTTGIHIARRIGEALSRAHNAELTLKYGRGEKSIRVLVTRN